MKKIILALFISTLRVVNTIVPKNKSLWLFHSVPDFAGNTRVLYEYLITTSQIDGKRILWLVESTESQERLREAAIPAVRRKSFKGIWCCFRASRIYTTHPHVFMLKVKTQLLVNLWHGMPIKAIGFFEDHSTIAEKRRWISRIDYTIVTSELMRAVLSAAFGLLPSKVLVAGQPRTDRFFMTNSSTRGFLEKTCRVRSKERVVLLLPTYRRDSEGKSSLTVLESHISDLNNVLKEKEAHVIIKPHPLELCDFDSIQSDRIHVVSDNQLGRAGVELYDLVREASVLCTDYSSVYVDYLMLDRPIIFLVPDMVEYVRTRGFLLHPFSFWTPGPKVKSGEDFVRELRSALDGNDAYREHRLVVRDLLHMYVDGNSSRRVAELLT